MRRLLTLVLLAAPTLAQTLVAPADADSVAQKLTAHAGEEALPCEIDPIPAVFSFNRRFLAGYTVRYSENPIGEAGHTWTALFQITPAGARPVFLKSEIEPPDPLEPAGGGESNGAFVLGSGRYRAKAVVLDDRGRACRAEWDIEATLRAAESQTMRPNTVGVLPSRTAQRVSYFAPDAMQRLTILLNAAAFSGRRSELSPREVFTLTSALSAMLLQVSAQSVRLVIFNLDQHRQLYRLENFASADLERVSVMLYGLHLGMVDYRTLQNRNGHMDLLARLVNRELEAANPSGAVVFVGPPSRSIDRFPASALVKPHATPPRFYSIQFQPLRRPPPMADGPGGRGGGGRGGGRGSSTQTTGTDAASSSPPPSTIPITGGANGSNGPGGAGNLGGPDASGAGGGAGGGGGGRRGGGPSFPAPDFSTASYPDSISSVVSRLKGKTFQVVFPADFEKAMKKIVPSKPSAKK